MITTNDFRKGMIIEMEDGSLWQVLEFQHVKPGKGGAFVRSKLKEILSGKVVDRTWRAGEKVQDVRIERRALEFLYRSDDQFCLMDPVSFEQVFLGLDLVGRAVDYMIENTSVDVLFHGSTPIIVEPPMFVELRVRRTDPGLRGDTASGGSKPAEMETGLVVQVPLFIREGDLIRIDTRTDAYIERKA
ncbi:elongation factor P [Candidatus Fermentibacterales bacterium]|nr:elongation factor P [Candidatus Fermentibacterales bacterium]